MKNQITSIQALRGAAAAVVVFSHVCFEFKRGGCTNSSFVNFYELRELGAAGVDLFFVVSGFIMVYVTYAQVRSQPTSRLEFCVNRIIRILPLYWICTTLKLILVQIPVFQSPAYDPSFILKSFLFLPDFNPRGELHPLLGQGWTLNYEMFFYLVFACLMMLRPRALLMVVSVVFLSLVTLGHVAPSPDQALWTFYTDPIILEFALGMLAGYLYVADRLPGKALGAILLASGAACWLATMFFSVEGLWRVAFWGIPAFFVLLGLTSLERASGLSFPKIFSRLGDASYSIYLTHGFCTNFVGFAIKRVFGSSVPYADAVIVILSVAFIVPGILSYRYLESPLTRFLKNAWQRKDRAQPTREPQGLPAVAVNLPLVGGPALLEARVDA
jgi:exopolysaccharide production protein ExoZ